MGTRVTRAGARGRGGRSDALRMNIISPQRIRLLSAVAVVAVSGATLASLFGRHHYLEPATHFRLQYALASTACVILLVVFRSRRLLPLALCCAALNWAYILPHYSTAARPGSRPAAVRIRLMLSNVQGNSKDYAALAAAVDEERPDVAVLQEITEEWQNRLEVLSPQYPYSKIVPRPGGSGMALFSRHPVEEVEVLTLDASTHPALFAKLNVEGTRLSLLALHPPTPVRPDKFSNRNQQLARAASLMRATPGAKLLVGDLNTTMWSPYFRDLIRESGLRDARLGFGLLPSWPAPLPAMLRIPIDHCLKRFSLACE